MTPVWPYWARKEGGSENDSGWPCSGPKQGGPEMTPVWPYLKKRKTIPADLILALRLQGGSRNDSGLGHPH